jgi:uncharacterized protein YodC (DUF2158 family)
MEIFQAGDLVTLKSGGPPMTVEWFDDMSDMYVCSWFTISHERQQQRFAGQALKIYSEQQPVRGDK